MLRDFSKYKNIATNIFSFLHVSICYILFSPRLNPFSREDSPQNSSPPAYAPKIRWAPELIRHLIGDVWAQHRGMRDRKDVRAHLACTHSYMHGPQS